MTALALQHDSLSTRAMRLTRLFFYEATCLGIADRREQADWDIITGYPWFSDRRGRGGYAYILPINALSNRDLEQLQVALNRRYIDHRYTGELESYERDRIYDIKDSNRWFCKHGEVLISLGDGTWRLGNALSLARAAKRPQLENHQ